MNNQKAIDLLRSFRDEFNPNAIIRYDRDCIAAFDLAIASITTLDALKARAQQIIDAGPILGQEPRLAAWFILSGEKSNVPEPKEPSDE